MIKWFKARTRTEKMMVILIAVLLVGIVIRWSYIRSHAMIWFRNPETWNIPGQKDTEHEEWDGTEQEITIDYHSR